jgi:protein tyrosine/serine phosphatase
MHCEAGSRRTGVAVAAYRILVDGWDADRAIAEAKMLRFVPQENAKSVAMLRQLAAQASAASQAAPPAK